MTKREDQRIAKLAKKNAAKIKPASQERAAQYDDTLRPASKDKDEDAAETERLFKEMKRREF